MYPYIPPLIRLILTLIFVAPVSITVADTVTQTQVTHTKPDTTQKAYADYSHAELFGLSNNEWDRYIEIMKGPRGYWTPNLDPLTVLGIHAETNAERRRYAEMLARLEHERVEKELAMQREYDAASKRLFPTLPLINKSRLSIYSPQNPETTMFMSGDRILFFTQADNCSRCDKLLTQLVTKVSASKKISLDIYIVGSNTGDNNVIRQWAKKHNIPVDLVKSHVITLNHDDGALLNLTNNSGNVPHVMVRRGINYFTLTNMNASN